MNMNTDAAARFLKAVLVLAVVLLSNALFLNTASAQFGTGFPGQYNLPQNDFTWTWGDQDSAGRGVDDFSILGNEAGFRCVLTGKLRIGTRMSRMDMRALEDDLRANMYFVRAAANAMYRLDASREIDWATLACEKPQLTRDEDQEKRDEREARALEKAARDRDRRRARRAREEEAAASQ